MGGLSASTGRVTDCAMDVADRNTDMQAQSACSAATEQHYTEKFRGTKRLVSLFDLLGGDQ
jgi:hypothetical protein